MRRGGGKSLHMFAMGDLSPSLMNCLLRGGRVAGRRLKGVNQIGADQGGNGYDDFE